ncbi:MAG: sigma-70 family RNA polymerase sigma factor [Candidatus Poribacteria bacterium]|nr:sigma-70 family RNA polymerase sigma factor [Candidatus Poribacteria bacterium]
MKVNDVDLIQRVLDGDQDAFSTLVNKYQKSVHALVWRKIGDFHIAEELTQDVFLKAYKRLSTLKRPEHFPGWLYVIATRHCVSWLRKKQVPIRSLDAMSTDELEEACYAQYEVARNGTAAIEQRRELVKRLLKKLPESERTVVTLYYLAEMSGEEISQFLGVSPNTVRSRLHRARQRLEKQEAIIQEVFGSFQLSPHLTENIGQEIARIKPATPSVSKPWLPWGFSFASTLLVILMIGTGPRALSRFQQPYNLDATSEMTIELVDTPIIQVSARKSDTRTQFGVSDTHGKNRGTGLQSEQLLFAAAQADETNLPVAKAEWVQTKGPGGVSHAGLFLASNRSLYAIAKTSLYRLSETGNTWTFVSASGPNREFKRVMAERDDTLYLLTDSELLVSIDEGKTWNSLGKRPEGRAIALMITDTAMYLVLQTEVFRSEDVGNQWEPIGQTLKADNVPEAGNPNFQIWDALAVDNTLFVGTSQGLFRFTEDWEKLPIPIPHGIFSLAATKDRLYVGTIASKPYGPHAAVFYSTDFGDSWTDITPNTHEHPVKIITAVNVIPAGDRLMLKGSLGVLLSDDGGETWTDPNPGPHTFGAFPIVALDKNTFYGTDRSRIKRSTDGGATWVPFTTGIVNSHISKLVALENLLYALTPDEMLKSADGGESWESISLIKTNAKASLEAANGVLYASNSELTDGVTFFRISDDGNRLLPVEDVPDFEEGTFLEKIIEAGKNDANADKIQEMFVANQARVIGEWKTNGTFTLSDNTVFMEYKHKLYRWRRGETAWHDTGLEDQQGISPIDGKGLTLAASANTVYAGKREGELFFSSDNGDTWTDVTENLAFPFGYFKEIRFAGKTVYVSTDMGIMRSRDGETWEVGTDGDGNRLIMDRIVVDGVIVYGACDRGIYEADKQTNTWKQIAAELPHTATAFAVEGRTFYIGTQQNGVFRFQRNDL